MVEAKRNATVIEAFPPVELADEYGLLAVGGDLEVPSLLLAYRSGIFPWPIEGMKEIPWFSPPERFLLFFSELRLSRTLKKSLKTLPYTLTVNRAFDRVIAACSKAKRKDQRGSWITSEMRKAYSDLHRAGYAQSVECWNGEELVGGLYGVGIGGMFAGESMFYVQPYASQFALAGLIELLESRGSTWLDCQQETPFFARFGARSVERDEFLTLLRSQIAAIPGPFPVGDLPRPKGGTG